MSTKKISQLPAAGSVAGADVLPIVQGGQTKRVTVSQLAVAGPTGPAGATGAAGPTGPAGVAETYQQGTAPASGSDGATWLDTSNNDYYVRFDGQWIKVGGST
jgi:hypothetical protein